MEVSCCSHGVLDLQIVRFVTTADDNVSFTSPRKQERELCCRQRSNAAMSAIPSNLGASTMLSPLLMRPRTVEIALSKLSSDLISEAD